MNDGGMSRHDSNTVIPPTTFITSRTHPAIQPTPFSESRSSSLQSPYQQAQGFAKSFDAPHRASSSGHDMAAISGNVGSTGKGILIGILSAFGSAGVAIVILSLFFFLRYTQRGRIFLDRLGRPGEYDDEVAFAREEADALENMDDLQKSEYLRAKAFVQAYPPESMQTDISLSQFLAIQEKGVSAWEFEPELEIANCFVEGRTEIEFFDSVCSVQSNLPVPKQNDVYYWEAKIYDKPESTSLSIGMTTKPYPLFRLPGYHKSSIAYLSSGHRRFNQPFTPTNYGPEYVQGDVIGIGYRPRSGTIFFTRNGKKLDDVAHGLKAQNFFPTVGANGPCTVHVNFGQMGFVFIEANVKKWGLAPMTGSLAPPPPYGSEQGSILLESGRESSQAPDTYQESHSRTRSGTIRLGQHPTPGPGRSPTDISLGPLPHVSSQSDLGEGCSGSVASGSDGSDDETIRPPGSGGGQAQPQVPPPEYSSPMGSPDEQHPEGQSNPTADTPQQSLPSYEEVSRGD